MEKINTEPSCSSIFSQKNSRLPEDTVFYAIFPDSSFPSKTLNPNYTVSTNQTTAQQLQSLHLEILNTIVSPYTNNYIWQHENFTLSLSSTPKPTCICSSEIPHLHGKLRFGDNLEDEWFVVFLLFEISRKFQNLSIRVWDTDGEFLLIETAFHLPRWINPENSANRVFIRRGELHIVPRDRFPSPSLVDSLTFMVNCGEESRAKDAVQLAVKNRISDYPERARKNMHCVRVRVPVSVAHVLKHEPCLISLAVEGFYCRDIDSMKFAAKMEKFLNKGSGEELVLESIKMSRAMYAQLVQQTFQAPKCYPMPQRSDASVYTEAELGMKIACGFEMMYQMRCKEGMEGKGSTWDVFRESLEKSDYFQGLLPGSKEYHRLMENAEGYYRNSSLNSRASEVMSAPVRRIDEILALPHSGDDFNCVNLPPSDDDSWLYNGEDELNSALLDREKEMELYNMKHKKKCKSKEHEDGTSSGTNLGDFDLGDIAKSMQAFVKKVSSYEGAEIPENRNLEDVNFDVDRFFNDMESVMRRQDAASDADMEQSSSSDMEFDESENDSDIEEDEAATFMDSYSDALNEELKTTTLKKSFVRANEQPSNNKMQEGTSNATEDMEEEFTPVDVDVNLVKNFLDSFSFQQGLPGPASNLLGLMGVQLPQDEVANKDK